MAPPKRPSLAGLVEPKASADPQAPAQTAEERDPAPVATTPGDLKTMQVRVNRAGWLEMSRLAQDRDVPLEALMVEAFNDVLTKHRKPPVVERRQPVKK
ncbi:hypothetical protein [Methylobacterium sp. J-092]|uniref:hypothetical protein n=1 Tax=Methylobacterium sp. J-092 TaxID=2836667 RepID=UPI001FB9FDD1|nr:hypothetical protein [Methylobacterium sp. J-092]MCJ2005632.1 hypothetical protein [Methylobacterium sp. J-092]